MSNDTIIYALAIATLVVGIVYGAFQIFKARKAKVEHRHSSITKGRPDQRTSHGAPGVPPQR